MRKQLLSAIFTLLLFVCMPACWTTVSAQQGTSKVLCLTPVDTMRIDTIVCTQNLPFIYGGNAFSGEGIYEFLVENAVGCDSLYIQLDLTIASVQYDTLRRTVCENDLPFQYGDTSFTEAVVYTENQQTADGCESLVTLVLTVQPAYALTDTVNATVCESELPYVISNTTLTEAGEHHITVPTQAGCDSIQQVVYLAVTPSPKDTLTVELCASELPYTYQGHIFTAGGHYNLLFPDTETGGCDTMRHLVLNAFPRYNDTIFAHICDYEIPYIFNGVSYNNSTVQTVYNQTIHGCDSITTLVLQVHTSYSEKDTLSLVVCESELPLHIDDVVLTSAGKHEYKVNTQMGCDSIWRVVNLTVIPSPKDSTTISVCANELPYHYGNEPLTEGGGYTFIIPNTTTDDCDTMRYIYLNVLPTYQDTLPVSICNNGFFVIGNDTLTDTGLYPYAFTTAQGCDSLVVYDVRIHDQQDTVHLAVCESEMPYQYFDTLLTSAGGYDLVNRDTTLFTCDSIVHIVLEIMPEYRDTITVTLCGSEPYLIGDSVLSEPGIYEVPLQTIAGCDSIVVVDLRVSTSPRDTLLMNLCANEYPYDYHGYEIAGAGEYDVAIPDLITGDCDTLRHLFIETLPFYHDSIQVTLCSNEVYTIGDSALTEPGVYDIYFSTIEGCDSIITVILNHNPAYWQDTTFVTICQNELPYMFEGQLFDTEGTHLVNFQTANGCDSILPLTLHIIPIVYNPDTIRRTICSDELPIVVFGRTLSEGGIYTYTTTSRVTGCDSVFYYRLMVNETPNVRINGRAQFCENADHTITATGASHYEWSSGEVTASITTNIAGFYSVTGTAANGCSATAEITLEAQKIVATISGNKYFCAGESTVLTVVSNENLNYLWQDGSTSASITAYMAGQYSVMVSNAIGCRQQIIATVTERPLPTPSITGNVTICEGKSTTLRVSGGTSYLWDDGSRNAFLNVNTTGTYSVTVTGSNQCSATISETVIVNPKPDVTLLANENICQGNTTTIYAISDAGYTYAWSTGQNSPIINVTPTTTTPYTVFVVDDNGCTNTATTTINVRPVPQPHINGAQPICQGDTAFLTATGGNDYLWSNGMTTNRIPATVADQYTVTVTNTHGCSAEASVNLVVNSAPIVVLNEQVSVCQGQTATLTASSVSNCTYAWSTGVFGNTVTVFNSGQYTVTATNSNGCSTLRTSNVTVHNLPQITMTGNTSICDGAYTQVTATSTESCLYAWSTGLRNATATFGSAGTYTVTATNLYGCANSAEVVISTHSTPQPVITGNLIVCPNGSTTLTATNGSSYLWNTGETSRTIVVSPSESSTYSVTVTDEFGCTGNNAVVVQLDEVPDIVISGNTSICAGQTTQLTATGGQSYHWSNNGTSANITVSQAGRYYVTATDSYGCTNRDSVDIIVHNNPTLSFGMQHYICEGQTYTYTLPSDDNLTYTWSNNATGHEITVATSGIYTVTATNAYGCSTTASDSLTVHPNPTPAITGETSLCRGAYSILTATGGSSYVWSTGDRNADIVVYPVVQTTYSVTATNAYGCSASTSATVVVRAIPSVNFSGNNYFCSGGSTTVTVSGGQTFSWSNGSTSNIVTISQPGTYTVTVTNSVGCQNSNAIEIAEYALPNLNILGGSTVCEGATLVLNATGAQNYLWSNNATGSSTIVSPTSTTIFSVTGTDEHGCSSVASKSVYVEALPDVHISGNLEFCQGGSTTLTATGGSSYMWYNGNANATIQVQDGGNYTVVASSANGCTASASVTVTEHLNPVAAITGASAICEHENATLHATGGASYLWNTGATTDEIVVSETRNYVVTVTSAYGCSTVASHNFTVLNAPYVLIVGPNNLCQDNSTTITTYSNAQSFLWSSGETTQAITITPQETTRYIVTATAANGCTAVDTMLVTVNPTYHNTIAASICQGNGYTQNGFNVPTQNEPGTFSFNQNLQTTAGCDSVITLNLTVKPLPVMPDTITGNNRIGNYGNYMYTVNDAQYVNSYEWRISNTHWTLTDNHINSAFLQISQNGSGTLYARGINECGYDEVSLSIYCNVAVSEYINETQILLYPNPTSQFLHINLEQAEIRVSAVQLFDNLGRCLQTVPVQESNLQMECGQYAAGTYFVKFIDEAGLTLDSRKVIIRK